MLLLCSRLLARCLSEDIAYAFYQAGAADALAGLLPQLGFLPLDAPPSLLLVDMRRPMALVQDWNGVSAAPAGKRRLGESMCVPYGKVLCGDIVPHTVTKALHAEKVFDPDLESFAITASPGYPPLLNLMRTQGRAVDCEDFIPNLLYWFHESLLYPFIGGDGMGGRPMQGSSILSVNLMPPTPTPASCMARRKRRFDPWPKRPAAMPGISSRPWRHGIWPYPPVS